MADDESQKDFSVVDRRVSVGDDAASGAEESKPENKSEDKGAEGPAQEAPPKDAAPGGEQSGPQEKGRPMPPVTFPTFLLSLHTSALIHLGLIPDPISNKQVVNLDLARQNIDLLEMLQKKTQGNLDDEETKLFDNILYELRMVYVQVCEGAGGEDCKA